MDVPWMEGLVCLYGGLEPREESKCKGTDTITYETTQDRTSRGETTDSQTQSTGDHPLPVSPAKEDETIQAHNIPAQPPVTRRRSPHVTTPDHNRFSSKFAETSAECPRTSILGVPHGLQAPFARHLVTSSTCSRTKLAHTINQYYSVVQGSHLTG